ncbi:3'-5' ssDNA/RNA exonuclease TatD [Mangrovibacter yixingensis]|uniref:3'-5' ssDNA/RNA exonuclease TatD n=1 Tax=Mangrovibacter yixingensis TaxID=1529639 RepID=UPI001CFD6A3C|nr:3'-5' ssDNA/RNA exonuclease TatD [Mangrovibacter yixingensis]
MFDIGVNLTSSQFDKDRADVVSRAQDAGVHGLLVTGTSVRESEQALACATEYKNCWATAGVHPHDASTWSETVAERIYRLTGQDKVVAVGECGLDFNRNFSSPLEQEQAFTAQLAIAAECELPVFLHCREAHDRFMALLKPWLNKLPAVVLHCFTGTREEAEICLAHGLYLGITGWVCDERRGLALRELLPVIPASQLLLETDAPYLLPRDLLPKPRSRRNEPCLLPHIFQQVARWRNEDQNELEAMTDNNVRRVFNIRF